MIPGMLAAGALCFAISLPATAQVQSTKMVDHGTPTSKVTVDRGEVVYVSGNDLVVKLDDGTPQGISTTSPTA